MDDKTTAARTYDTHARRVRGVAAHGGVDGRGRLFLLNFPTPAERAAAPPKAEQEWAERFTAWPAEAVPSPRLAKRARTEEGTGRAIVVSTWDGAACHPDCRSQRVRRLVSYQV